MFLANVAVMYVMLMLLYLASSAHVSCKCGGHVCDGSHCVLAVATMLLDLTSPTLTRTALCQLCLFEISMSSALHAAAGNSDGAVVVNTAALYFDFWLWCSPGSFDA